MTDENKTPKKPLTLGRKVDIKDIVNTPSRGGGSHGKTVVVEVKKSRGDAAKKTRQDDLRPQRMRAMKIDPLHSEKTVENTFSEEELLDQDIAKDLTEEERTRRLNVLKQALGSAEEVARKEQERIERELKAAEDFQRRKEVSKSTNESQQEIEAPVSPEEIAVAQQDLPSPEDESGRSQRHHKKDERKRREDGDDKSDSTGAQATRRYSVEDRPSKKESPPPVHLEKNVYKRATSKMSVSRALSGGDEEDIRVRSYASIKRAREKERQRQQEADKKAQQKIVRDVIIPETITIQELSNRMAERSSDVIKALMKMGMMVTITQSIDADTAQIIVEELGHKAKRVSDDDVELNMARGSDVVDTSEMLERRAPVVTIMGHVDHGKTSLLDALRETDVALGEAGGITQHIGAYQVTLLNGEKITFIDTPGHAAFTEMRARGANATDIVVLVVAADDGVKDQTIEAIKHAQAAEVPIVVAINKMDKPGADPTRVKTELLQHTIVMEDLGGDVLSAEISAKQKRNLEKLEEIILLQAEVLDLKANPNRSAEGVVIEAKLEKGRGPVATILIQRGTLKVGDVFVAGSQWGRVRALINDHGAKVENAGPSQPIEVIGFDGAPQAGDQFVVVADEAKAREVAAYRDRKRREKTAALQEKQKMENLFSPSAAGGKKELAVLIKSDVQGSSEAISSSLKKLENEELSVKILSSGVGGISESDVSLARTGNALMIGFNVRASSQAREAALKAGIEIRYYSIIYDVINDVKAVLSGLLSPILQENFIGRAVVREVFRIPKIGTVAGCYVSEGLVKRGSKIRLIRDDVVIHEGALKTLKRFKDEVKEVKENVECGMAFESYQDIQLGDIIECSEILEVKRTLE